MKKRLLWIVIMGLSFSPTALAGKRVGELSLAETNMAGVKCEKMKSKILAQSEGQKVSGARDGSAGVAR